MATLRSYPAPVEAPAAEKTQQPVCSEPGYYPTPQLMSDGLAGLISALQAVSAKEEEPEEIDRFKQLKRLLEEYGRSE